MRKTRLLVKAKKNLSIPDHCPLMKNCNEDITFDEWEVICNSENWIACDQAEKPAKKYKAKPSIWKLVSEIDTKEDRK